MLLKSRFYEPIYSTNQIKLGNLSQKLLLLQKATPKLNSTIISFNLFTPLFGIRDVKNGKDFYFILNTSLKEYYVVTY